MHIKTKILFLSSFIFALFLLFLPIKTLAETDSSIPVPTITTVRNEGDYVKISFTVSKKSAVDKYMIYRSENGGKYKLIATSDYYGAFSDKNLTAGNKYSYKIKSVKGSDTSSYSNVKSTYRIPTVKINSVTATTKSITIKWNKGYTADGYKIYRKKTTDTEYKLLFTKVGADNTTLVNTSPVAGVQYQYMICPYKKYGNTNYVNWVGKTVSFANLTEKVTGIKVTSPSDRTVNISWDSCRYAKSYIVSQKNLTTGACKNRTYSNNVTSASFMTSYGGQYSYTVRAQYEFNYDTTSTIIGPFSDKKVVDVGGCRTHDYTEIITKKATCTATGTLKKVCKYCGHTETETIAKLAHQYGDVEIIKESVGCNSYGVKKETCKVCGYVHQYQYTAKAHTYEDHFALRFLNISASNVADKYAELTEEDVLTAAKSIYTYDKYYAEIGSYCSVCHTFASAKSLGYNFPYWFSVVTLPTETTDGKGVVYDYDEETNSFTGAPVFYTIPAGTAIVDAE